MKFKSVYFGHSRFVVNKNEKKKKNDEIALKLEMCPQYMDAPALTPSPAQGHDPVATVPYI